VIAVDQYGGALAEAIEAALPIWVHRCVSRIMTAWTGTVAAEVEEAAEAAGLRARAEVGGRVRDLLARDIDDQASTPLSILRAAVAFPTEVLHAAGVPPVERDEFRVRAFPEDVYDLSPASFADVDLSLHEVAMAWGAAKAMAHRERHGSR
jgi:hypothetical protein